MINLEHTKIAEVHLRPIAGLANMDMAKRDAVRLAVIGNFEVCLHIGKECVRYTPSDIIECFLVDK